MPYFVELSSLVMAIGIRDFLSVLIISIKVASTGTEHRDQHTDSGAGGQGLRMSKS